MRDTSLASRARSLIRKKSSRTPRVPAAPLAPPDVPDDLETLITIAKLNLEDIDQVTNSRKGKGKEGSLPSHEEMAYQVQQEELTKHLRYLEGIRSAHSLDKVVATNRACLAAIIEAAESEDRRAAELLFCGQPLPPPSALQRRMADPTFSFLPEVKEEDRALGGAVSQKQLEIPLKFPPLELKDESDQQRESMEDIDPDEQYLLQKMVFAKGFRAGRELSSDGAGPSGIHREDYLVECTACGEALKTEEFESLHSPCGHILCRECVQRFIELFIGDE